MELNLKLRKLNITKILIKVLSYSFIANISMGYNFHYLIIYFIPKEKTKIFIILFLYLILFFENFSLEYIFKATVQRK